MAISEQSSPEDLFEVLLADVLKSPDIRRTLAETGVSEDDLLADVRERRNEILHNFDTELGAYEAAVEDVKAMSPPVPVPPASPEAPPEAPPAKQKAVRLPRGPAVADPIVSLDRAQQEQKAFARQADLEAADAQLRQQLEVALSDELRTAMNRRYRKPAHETKLDLQSTEGLAQVVDQRLEVPTQAAKDLAELLRKMKGGSVGVSGARGAGKTTLLRRFYEGREPIGTRELLGVMVPAPVAYDSREFLTHLFAELCQKAGAVPPAVEPRSEDSPPAWHWPATAGRLLLAALAILAPLGALAGLGGLLVSVQSTIGPQVIWGVALILAGVALSLLVGPIIEWLSDDRTPPPLVQFVGAVLFFAGISCGAGGVALIVVEIFGESASAAAVRAGALLLGTTALVLSALTVLRRFPPAKLSATTTPTWPSDSLANLASRSLEEIRYQQTYAHGWSGTLSVPLGLGAGVTADTSLARYAMTYPEVVARLRNLLTLAAARYDVLIVIDELDKLESGEKADRFLNELKAVFGVAGTYFLVSVSEDAMSRFERRGLSFRDVFDSTFDEIIRVRPLALGESQTLLSKRVVGLPLIYSGLCHVMSGGLPRDLIRTARRIVEIHERDDQPDELEMLTATLLADELQSKTEAVRYAARADAAVEPLLTWFLDWLKEYGETPTAAAPLIARCEAIQELATVKLSLTSAVDPDGRAARSTLLRMGLELGAYAYFAATILEIFRNDLSEDEIRLAADGAGEAPYLDALARAHAGFVVNAKTAWLSVTQFRTDRALEPILDLSQPAIT